MAVGDEEILRRLRSSGAVANVVGALVVFAALAGPSARDDIPADRRAELGVVFAIVMAVAAAVVITALEQRAVPFFRAFLAGEPLTGPAARALFSLPRHSAVWTAGGWFVGAVVFGLHSVLRLDNDLLEAAALVVSITLGGMTTGCVVYLLNERHLRPAFARAFADDAPEGVRGLEVGRRLVLAWALGSGVPLLVIGLGVLDPEADAGQIRRQTLPWVVLGLAAGAVITLRMARSLAEPLSRLRDAMGDVRHGRYSVRAAVDDATEVGLLQSGFNDMVTGLQERERIRDLFGRHVGQEVAQRAMARDLELGGEKVDATALFVDIAGSTTFGATHDASEVVDVLNRFFAVVVAAIEAEGGWVNKFEGDAALCVFGPPVDHTDHADRALRAARRLQTSLAKLRQAFPDLDAGIGVSSGTVVAGNVGSESRLEYTVIGDPVNEAARLTDEAKVHPRRLLASEESLNRAGAEEATCWVEDGALQLRGRPTPTGVWVPR